jgi:hypothetical protein
MALADELEKSKQKLVNEAGRALVQKTIDDLTLSPEEKARRAAEDEAASRMRMVKLILGGVGILVVGVVIMRLLARLWLWGIALVVVGGVAAAAWFAFKPQLEAFKAKRLAARAEADAARTAAARDAAARKAEADAKQKLEDELARLKKQV